ncbi:unnamed protein product [Rotaria sordida]|uniref:Uncharacterized protein n=1 Tax=Rotaria sordida TaxID=392033 RepID=A0A818JVJ2_9BILA|nr:unnamed protein product [Rotaria sordida]CAF0866738.1 unnamed protein product [Rotaria sordida]CAF3548144.1 unnamed protein product [Rotaria sordida]CAF3624204.1 unnamed protein product [Rotaria sordida]
MMKVFFIFFAAIFLPICTSRCEYGCTCYNDDTCEYYCSNHICQNQIPLWKKCSGYYTHPRECGTVSYCDPYSNYTCQLQKNYGERCTLSYSCLSGYCNYRTNTCQSKDTPSDWLIPIVLPSVLVVSLIMIFFILIIARRQRRRRLAYYQSPYVVLPPDTCYSYQNSCMVTESSPPPYPGTISPQLPKTYQN